MHGATVKKKNLNTCLSFIDRYTVIVTRPDRISNSATNSKQ